MPVNTLSSASGKPFLRRSALFQSPWVSTAARNPVPRLVSRVFGESGFPNKIRKRVRAFCRSVTAAEKNFSALNSRLLFLSNKEKREK